MKEIDSEELKKEKKQEDQEQERLNTIMSYYEGGQVTNLGGDGKNMFFLNRKNEELLFDLVNNSPLEIELRALSDVIIIDCFYKKYKEFVATIKKVSGVNAINSVMRDKKLVIYVNGDKYYNLKDNMKKYYLLRELTRILYNYEKDKYRILKYDYQNNSRVINEFGTFPKSEDVNL